MGEGSAKEEIERLVDRAPAESVQRVVLVPHGDPREVQALLDTADLGLVSLSADVIRYAFPSKTATYLGAGVPVLARVEPDSALAWVVLDHGIGGLLPVDDVAGTGQTLVEWVARRDELPAMRRRGLTAGGQARSPSERPGPARRRAARRSGRWGRAPRRRRCAGCTRSPRRRPSSRPAQRRHRSGSADRRRPGTSRRPGELREQHPGGRPRRGSRRRPRWRRSPRARSDRSGPGVAEARSAS